MYMGPAWKLERMLRGAIALEDMCLGDDQRALNVYLSSGAIDYEIDYANRFFKNLNLFERNNYTCEPIAFVSQPGEVSWRRLSRASFEYSRFLWPELLLVVLLVVIIVINLTKRADHKKRVTSSAI